MESKKIEIGGRKYVLNKIPAFQAQKIAFHCFGAFRSKNLCDIPDEVLLQVCSYIGAVNPSGAEIQLTDEDLIAINVKDAGVLMQLELRELEYNFDFFFDGSLFREVAAIIARISPAANQEADSSKV